MSNEHRVAIIRIDSNKLLEWLDFEGGTILHILQDGDTWDVHDIQIVLEHPDLPLVMKGDTLRRVTPRYLYKQNCRGNYYERVEPKKEKDIES